MTSLGKSISSSLDSIVAFLNYDPGIWGPLLGFLILICTSLGWLIYETYNEKNKAEYWIALYKDLE